MRRALVVLATLLGGCATASEPPPQPPPAPETANEDPAPVAVDAEDSMPAPGVQPPSKTKAPVAAKRKPPVELEPVPLTDLQRSRARAVQRHVRAAAKQFELDPNLLNGIIWAESKFNPKARSRAGARGLMQLMPVTSKAMAKRLGRAHRPYDPAFSIFAGAQLLAVMKERFDGDETLMLFAFARGGGTVRKYQREGGEIPKGVLEFIDRVDRARWTFAQMGYPDAA